MMMRRDIIISPVIQTSFTLTRHAGSKRKSAAFPAEQSCTQAGRQTAHKFEVSFAAHCSVCAMLHEVFSSGRTALTP